MNGDFAEHTDKPESETQFVVGMGSLILGLAGCYGIMIPIVLTHDVKVSEELVLGIIFIVQAILTVLFKLEAISFNIWGWIE